MPSFFRQQAQKSLLVLLTAIFTTSLTGTSNADDLGFSARSFGKLLLVPNQTTGGHADLIAAQDGGAFEPISEFNIEDRYRKFGAPVARLDMLSLNKDGDKLFGVCTANLIAPDVLLTNYHCIPGMDPDSTVIRAIAVFDFLREDQTESPTFEVDISPIAADYSLDFALLRVAGNPGTQFGHFQLQAHSAKPNQSLFLIHHPAGMPKRLTRFRCKAYAPKPYANTLFRHRCDTLGGSSGSLLFNLDFEVVALHNKGGLNNNSLTSFNSGISIFSLLDHPAFAEFMAQPKPDAPKVGAGLLRPMADLLADQAKAKANANDPSNLTVANTPPLGSQNKIKDGFSLYDPKNYKDGKLPAQLVRNPVPLTANAMCDTIRGGRICASSMLKPQGSGKYNYRMANLASNDGMAWVENRKDHGIGEWLVFDFSKPKSIREILFRNGYTRTGKTFSTNSRVWEITIELSNGNSYRVAMSDNPDPQVFTLPESQSVNWVKLTIDSVFKGSKYADTALSYVEFR